MDELDLLLETLPVEEVTVDETDLSPAELALEEFTNAKSPADRLEALKLLVMLAQK